MKDAYHGYHDLTKTCQEEKTLPAMVKGSITKIKSQSTSGRSTRGCLFSRFIHMLVMDDPTMQKLLKGIACFGENPNTKIRSGTRIPPPPIPPEAAINNPSVTNIVPHISDESKGKRSLWCVIELSPSLNASANRRKMLILPVTES